MAYFKTENNKGFSVITMQTERLDGQTIPELRSELVLLSGSSISNIIIDLSSCNYCDTVGLSAILIAHRLCKNGHLVLVGIDPNVEKMLSIQRFDPELVIRNNIKEASRLMQEYIESK